MKRKRNQFSLKSNKICKRKNQIQVQDIDDESYENRKNLFQNMDKIQLNIILFENEQLMTNKQIEVQLQLKKQEQQHTQFIIDFQKIYNQDSKSSHINSNQFSTNDDCHQQQDDKDKNEMINIFDQQIDVNFESIDEQIDNFQFYELKNDICQIQMNTQILRDDLEQLNLVGYLFKLKNQKIKENSQDNSGKIYVDQQIQIKSDDKIEITEYENNFLKQPYNFDQVFQEFINYNDVESENEEDQQNIKYIKNVQIIIEKQDTQLLEKQRQEDWNFWFGS